MKEDKGNAWINVVFISTILLLFTIADFFTSDRIFSENENRMLAKRPSISVDKVIDGTFMKEYDSYVTDQFINRDIWIMLKTRGDILLQKKEINGVYLGKDDYFIEQHLAEDIDEEKVAEKLQLLGKLVDQYDAQVMLVPTADNILKEKLPANAIYYNQAAFIEQVKQEVGSEHVIDVFPVLQSHADEDIYYRTDHHWTTLGAYYGYQEWIRSMGKIEYYYDMESLETVSDTFLGTLHSRINLPAERKDVIEIFPITRRRPVSITYDYQKRSNSLYEEKYLKTKNQYGFFLDDNHGFVEVETSKKNGKALFIIKDSYANCILPMMIPHYEKVYIVDLRYYRGKLFELIDQQDEDYKMDVMVLYNVIHFIENFQYY